MPCCASFVKDTAAVCWKKKIVVSKHVFPAFIGLIAYLTGKNTVDLQRERVTVVFHLLFDAWLGS